MNFSEYQALARRTQNPALTTPERTLHALHGLSAEIGEVIDAVACEAFYDELGDLCWFIAEYCDALGWDMGELEDECGRRARIITSQAAVIDTKKNLELMTVIIGRIHGRYQKEYQGHLLLYSILKEEIKWLITAIMVIVNIERVMEENIAKLRNRYPKGFAAERSLQREE